MTFVSGNGDHAEDPDAATMYMADLAGRFGDAEKPFEIVVDAGNGMAGAFAPTLIRYMRHDLIRALL